MIVAGAMAIPLAAALSRREREIPGAPCATFLVRAYIKH